MFAVHLVAAVIALFVSSSSGAPDKPNIMMVLTDDEDMLLGGASSGPLPRVANLFATKGATFSNHFVHTPVCCPSRSEVLTGRYFHNLHWTPPAGRWDAPDGVHGRQCMHIDESKLSPGPTFAQHLANVGYKVLYVGKYLNISPLRAPTGAHTYMVNPGPSAHSALDKSGEYYPEYWLHINQTYNGTFNFSGLPQHSRYETAFIGNFTTEWLKEFGNTGPFMAYIAPHAPHGAAIPAPWYQDQFPNATAPITPSYNYSGADHHWLVAQQPPTRAAEVVSGNAAFRNRWRCLLSVDDMIISLRSTLQELGLLQSTYMMFSSDHAFHFHELRLGVGKWNVYDVDTHVHLHVTGPGVRPGMVLPMVTSHIDFAPTWLGLAGVSTPTDTMDGRSFVGALVDPNDPLVSDSVRRHLRAEAATPKLKTNRPNGTAYIEYHGLENFVGNANRIMDSLNNTYRGVRIIAGDDVAAGVKLNANGDVVGNVLFAEWGGDYLFKTVVFEELFDCHTDPWQMHNIINQTDPAILNKLRSVVHTLWQCAGDSCR